MKRFAIVVLLLLVVVIAVGTGKRRRTAAPIAAPVVAPARPTTIDVTIVPPGDAAPAPSPTSVRKLTHEDRARLGAQIRASIAKAQGTAGPGEPPSLPVLRIEDIGEPAKQALSAAIELLAACYPTGSDRPIAVARMTMISDPALGTVIDTDEITDEAGAKLAPAIDTCLRDTIDSLAIPPLGPPGKLALQYSFRFE